MAMEDAIALAFSLRQNGPDLERTFAAYETERRPRVEAIQRASFPSLRWYEQFRHYWDFGIERFSFHFLTRANLDYGQLREKDPSFVEAVEEAVAPELADFRSRVIFPGELESEDRLLVQLGRGGELHRLLSPLTNPSGGSLEKRMAVPLKAVAEARAAHRGELWVEISAYDWLPGGFTDDDAVVLASRLKELGVDVVLVGSGHVVPASIPWYGRCFNAPFSDRVRNEAHVQTAVRGGILSADDARNVLYAGRADLVVADRVFDL
jgi:anthraniloyl-CoA monooxygenase